MTWLLAGGYALAYLAFGNLCHFLIYSAPGVFQLLEYQDNVLLSQCVAIIPLTILLVFVLLYFYRKKARWETLSLAGALLLLNGLGLYYAFGPLRPIVEYLIGFMTKINRLGYFSWIAIILLGALFILLIRQKKAASPQENEAQRVTA